MNYLLAKLNKNSTELFKVMTSNERFFELPALSETHDFSPQYKLEDEEWYHFENFSTLEFKHELINSEFDGINYSQISKESYRDIYYFCSKQENYFLFQKTNFNQMLTKKWFEITDAPTLEENKPIIILNNHVDVVYDKLTDRLYFRDFSKLKILFKDIEKIYREATHEEVNKFLSSDFIRLHEDYSIGKVKIANRKRIAIAIDSLSKYSEEEKNKIFNYIKSYCEDVPTEGNVFKIGTEAHLKKVLYGINEQYYTTFMGQEKRLANSVKEIK